MIRQRTKFQPRSGNCTSGCWSHVDLFSFRLFLRFLHDHNQWCTAYAHDLAAVTHTNDLLAVTLAHNLAAVTYSYEISVWWIFSVYLSRVKIFAFLIAIILTCFQIKTSEIEQIIKTLIQQWFKEQLDDVQFWNVFICYRHLFSAHLSVSMTVS